VHNESSQLTVHSVTEHRHLGSLAYKIKCKRKNQVKTAALKFVYIRRTRFFIGSIGYK